MLAQAEDELQCDMAEAYRIYDMKELQPFKAAVFASGLKADSRTKMKMSGMEHDINTVLLAAIADRLSLLVWFNSEDGKNGENRPMFFSDQLFGEPEKEVEGYGSIEELEAAFRRFEEG